VGMGGTRKTRRERDKWVRGGLMNAGGKGISGQGED
jgi:hypothetical protein